MLVQYSLNDEMYPSGYFDTVAPNQSGAVDEAERQLFKILDRMEWVVTVEAPTLTLAGLRGYRLPEFYKHIERMPTYLNFFPAWRQMDFEAKAKAYLFVLESEIRKRENASLPGDKPTDAIKTPPKTIGGNWFDEFVDKVKEIMATEYGPLTGGQWAIGGVALGGLAVVSQK